MANRLWVRARSYQDLRLTYFQYSVRGLTTLDLHMHGNCLTNPICASFPKASGNSFWSCVLKKIPCHRFPPLRSRFSSEMPTPWMQDGMRGSIVWIDQGKGLAIPYEQINRGASHTDTLDQEISLEWQTTEIEALSKNWRRLLRAVSVKLKLWRWLDPTFTW